MIFDSSCARVHVIYVYIYRIFGYRYPKIEKIILQVKIITKSQLIFRVENVKKKFKILLSKSIGKRKKTSPLKLLFVSSFHL